MKTKNSVGKFGLTLGYGIFFWYWIFICLVRVLLFPQSLKYYEAKTPKMTGYLSIIIFLQMSEFFNWLISWNSLGTLIAQYQNFKKRTSILTRNPLFLPISFRKQVICYYSKGYSKDKENMYPTKCNTTKCGQGDTAHMPSRVLEASRRFLYLVSNWTTHIEPQRLRLQFF